MKKICVGLTLLVAGVLFALPAPALTTPAVLALGAAARPAQKHPEMEAALQALRQARFHLNHAATAYGGHRVNALRATDRAVREIDAALDYAATKHVERIPAAPPALGGQRKPVKGFPYIHDAINELNNAKAHLQKGATDFGGHRLAAIRQVNEALSECRAALRYVHSR